ncbi:uncharacterized protein LOC111244146 isoform X2 [Varroa destructor]|nr:uncharacterized protein LOC111244146 isoform X2 [Varroa destructor]
MSPNCRKWMLFLVVAIVIALAFAVGIFVSVRLAGSNASSNGVKRGGIGSGGVAMPINDNDIESTTRVPAITPPVPEEETTAALHNAVLVSLTLPDQTLTANLSDRNSQEFKNLNRTLIELILKSMEHFDKLPTSARIVALESGSIKVKIAFEFEEEQPELGARVNQALRRFLHANGGHFADASGDLTVLLDSIQTKEIQNKCRSYHLCSWPAVCRWDYRADEPICECPPGFEHASYDSKTCIEVSYETTTPQPEPIPTSEPEPSSEPEPAIESSTPEPIYSPICISEPTSEPSAYTSEPSPDSSSESEFTTTTEIVIEHISHAKPKPPPEPTPEPYTEPTAEPEPKLVETTEPFTSETALFIASVAEPAPESTPEPNAEPTAEPFPDSTSASSAKLVPEPTSEASDFKYTSDFSTPEPAAELTTKMSTEVVLPHADNRNPKHLEDNNSAVTAEPAPEPTTEPTPEPTTEPTPEPTTEPTPEPTTEPAPESTVEPAPESTVEPAPEPTAEPVPEPTVEPALEPTVEPAPEPTVEPAPEPTVEPAPEPTVEPAPEPTVEPAPEPTVEPAPEPTVEPAPEPTVEPAPEPTVEPAPEPTVEPAPEPTVEPAPEPTVEPAPEPTVEPAPEPTVEPTPEPTAEPAPEPTAEPAPEPTAEPAPAPSTEATPEPVSEPPAEPTPPLASESSVEPTTESASEPSAGHESKSSDKVTPTPESEPLEPDTDEAKEKAVSPKQSATGLQHEPFQEATSEAVAEPAAAPILAGASPSDSDKDSPSTESSDQPEHAMSRGPKSAESEITTVSSEILASSTVSPNIQGSLADFKFTTSAPQLSSEPEVSEESKPSSQAEVLGETTTASIVTQESFIYSSSLIPLDLKSSNPNETSSTEIVATSVQPNTTTRADENLPNAEKFIDTTTVSASGETSQRKGLSLDEEVTTVAVNETTSITSALCRETEFLCDTKCIDLSLRCDGLLDCFDQSDEANCVQTKCERNYLCANSTICIPQALRCDGVKDCPDADDEADCAETIESCEGLLVLCPDKSYCIKPSQVCDGVFNCRDRSDESKCQERNDCENVQKNFFCPKESLCIDGSLRCDGHKDCQDGADEQNCTCLPEQFQCDNAYCVSKPSARCDGVLDCKDGTDELDCLRTDDKLTVEVFDPMQQQFTLLCGDNFTARMSDAVCQEMGFQRAANYEQVKLELNGTQWASWDESKTASSALFSAGVQGNSSCSGLAVRLQCQEIECTHKGQIEFLRRRRETGAVDSDTDETPWSYLVLVVGPNNSTACHGQVITPQHLITSALCLKSLEVTNPDQLKIYSSHSGDRRRQEFTARSAFYHPHFSQFRSKILPDYDVAVIRAKIPMTIADKRIRPVCIYKDVLVPGITCFVDSYGNGVARSHNYTTTVSKMPLVINDSAQCNQEMIYDKQVSQQMICASADLSGNANRQPCDTDIGAPLMCLSAVDKWKLAGLLSYQRYCGRFNKQPTIFASVHSMQPWINKVTGMSFYNVTKSHVKYYLPAEPETTMAPSTPPPVEDRSDGAHSTLSPPAADSDGSETTTLKLVESELGREDQSRDGGEITTESVPTVIPTEQAAAVEDTSAPPSTTTIAPPQLYAAQTEPPVIEVRKEGASERRVALSRFSTESTQEQPYPALVSKPSSTTEAPAANKTNLSSDEVSSEVTAIVTTSDVNPLPSSLTINTSFDTKPIARADETATESNQSVELDVTAHSGATSSDVPDVSATTTISLTSPGNVLTLQSLRSSTSSDVSPTSTEVSQTTQQQQQQDTPTAAGVTMVESPTSSPSNAAEITSVSSTTDALMEPVSL